jgi:hypothetical protein
MTSPQVVTITFDGWSYRNHAEDYASWIVGSSWLSTVGADYGVGLGSTSAPVHLSLVPPNVTDDTTIQSFLSSKIEDGTLPAPLQATSPTGPSNTIYMLYYPASTTIYLDDQHTQVSCTTFAGYHDELIYNQQHIPYAVLPDCSNVTGVVMPDDLDVAVSHELIEAATDPLYRTNQAYIISDYTNPWYWTGGEVADMCLAMRYTDPATGNIAQRIWSNSLALGSRSPCAPTPLSVGFIGEYVTPNNIQYVDAGVGGSVNIAVHGFTTNSGEGWFAEVFNAGGSVTATEMPDYSQNGMLLSNGATINLSLTLPEEVVSGDYLYYWVYGYDPLGSDSLWWPVVVYVP